MGKSHVRPEHGDDDFWLETKSATLVIASPSGNDKSWRRNVGLMTAATVGVGIANYLSSLAIVRLLPAREFAAFAAGQSLLLVLGTGSLAALPWAVARYLATQPSGSAQGQAMYFGLVASAIQAAILGPIALAVCWALDGPGLGFSGLAAAVMISMLAGPTGFLQGLGKLRAIAATRIVETAVRIALGLGLLVLFSRNASLALAGFGAGSTAALGYALCRGRSGFPLRRTNRATVVQLTRQALSLGMIQALLAAMGALDTVYVDAGHFAPTAAASYQAAALLGRVPLFFSSAVSTASYTALVQAPDEGAIGAATRGSLRTFIWLSYPFLLACLTLPQRLMNVLVPESYTATLPILKMMCLSGVLVGLINVVTTTHQARGRYRSATLILLAGVIAQAMLLLGAVHFATIREFALLELAVCALTACVLLVDARAWIAPYPWTERAVPIVALVTAAGGAAMVRSPVLWLLLIFAAAITAWRLALSEHRTQPLPA